MTTPRWHWSSFVFGLAISVLILISALGGAVADRLFVIKPLDRFSPRYTSSAQPTLPNPAINVVEPTIKVAESSRNSVVTIAAKHTVTPQPWSFLFAQPNTETSQTVQQDIGSGFSVAESDGLIVTNRHVVADPQSEYSVFDAAGTEYQVQQIYRDPINDLAILATSAHLPALNMADSDQVKVGQTVIAIGTALGEFRQTVTAGVISGLGRGIEASDGFSAEKIDNLIQTDAAINPGNSGGPLLNTQGEVIGVNVAMAQAQNISFALPINIVSDSLANFNQTGRFDRPLLGVEYKLIPAETAVLNNIPQGAYIVAVLADSTAATMNVQVGDILTKINGQAIKDLSDGIPGVINQQKIGDPITLEVWRNQQTQTLSGSLKSAVSSPAGDDQKPA